MIGFLEGIPRSLSTERVILDVGGVGYEVHVPLSTYYELERAAGARVGLFIHTYLREGELSLFGFWNEREKKLFEKLIAVSGIGPRLARVILSGLPIEEVLGAIASGDAARLTSIPGVGKKTAQRMVLELKDRVRELAAGLPATASPADDDVTSALVNLGYKPAQAEKTVAAVRQDQPEAEFHEVLRASLKRLSRL